ncbi:MAG: alpha/beta fold hydrolase [Cryomorphaceae bacterium]|nr:alpha/beta fold hydrolase [Cryomorphaceae bacterium]
MGIKTSFKFNYKAGNIESGPIMVMLHGYGSHENDLFGFAPELPDHFTIYSLRAPIPMGFGGHCWYQIDFEATESENRSDDKQAKASRDLIIEFLEEVKNHHGGERKVFLMGFSQGCILSYAVAFSRPDLVDKVLALSGYIHTPILPEKTKYEALKHIEFYVAHGALDPVLPVEWARKSVAFLEANKINHQYREYPIGHGIDAAGFHDLKKFLE